MKLGSTAFFGCLILAVAVAGLAGTAEAAKKNSGADGNVVARIGDHQITLEQVDAAARAANMQAYQALYDARKSALDALVNEELVRLEAKAQGVAAEDLANTQVTQKITPVTDADVKAYYDQNTARMRGQPLEKIGPQIRNFLVAQNTAKVEKEFYDGLRKKHAISVTLDPPRATVTIAANDPVKGPADAPITIVEFSEFQ